MQGTNVRAVLSEWVISKVYSFLDTKDPDPFGRSEFYTVKRWYRERLWYSRVCRHARSLVKPTDEERARRLSDAEEKATVSSAFAYRRFGVRANGIGKTSLAAVRESALKRWSSEERFLEEIAFPRSREERKEMFGDVRSRCVRMLQERQLFVGATFPVSRYTAMLPSLETVMRRYAELCEALSVLGLVFVETCRPCKEYIFRDESSALRVADAMNEERFYREETLFEDVRSRLMRNDHWDDYVMVTERAKREALRLWVSSNGGIPEALWNPALPFSIRRRYEQDDDVTSF